MPNEYNKLLLILFIILLNSTLDFIHYTITGKIRWKLIDEDGEEHKHKANQNQKPIFKHRRVIDIATVTDLQEVKNLFALGWEYKISYRATIANIPHYVLVKKE